MILIIYHLCGIAQVNRAAVANPCRSSYPPFIRHYGMIPSREAKSILAKLIPALHPTNCLWQLLMLFDSHRLSLGKICKRLYDCPLCFSPSVRGFCLLPRFHNHAELLLQREGGPREKAHSPDERGDIAFLSVSLYLEIRVAPLSNAITASPLSQCNNSNSPPDKRLV